MTETGTQERAAEIAEYHHGGALHEPRDVEQVGAGSQRTVYVDHRASVVYKLGEDGANRQEVYTLAALRAAGADHAPEATLYEVTVAGEHGDPIACTVVAMPYLPDDGSVARPYPILEGAADFNPAGNVHANGGRLWLIDAGGL